MSPANEVERKIIKKSKLEAVSLEREVTVQEIVNWKLPLAMGLTQINETSVNYQRAWAALCHSMRTLCPETNWIMVDQADSQFIDLKALHQFQNWLQHLIAVPEWPFPKEVIITSYASKEYYGWQLLIPSFHKKLPYYMAPSNFALIPLRDKYSAGWNFQSQQSFVIKKAGEA